MPRPLIPIENQLTERTLVSTTKAVDDRLRAIAKKKFKSRSFVINEALHLYFAVLDEKKE
jgi:predicted transcriptional regulator